jgi:hypothetical protein
LAQKKMQTLTFALFLILLIAAGCHPRQAASAPVEHTEQSQSDSVRASIQAQLADLAAVEAKIDSAFAPYPESRWYQEKKQAISAMRGELMGLLLAVELKEAMDSTD